MPTRQGWGSDFAHPTPLRRDDDVPVGRSYSPSSRNVGHFYANGFQQRFDPALRDSTRDEDDALEPGGRVKDMLDAVDHRRPVRALRNVHDTLQAQEIGAAMLSKGFEKIRSA